MLEAGTNRAIRPFGGVFASPMAAFRPIRDLVLDQEVLIVSICSFEGVHKSYRTDFLRRRKDVLMGVEFELEAGETFAYLGHNGVGKTTTIKALLGLIKPEQGRISVFGSSPGRPEALSRLGYLPESPYFYDHLSAREFLSLVAQLHGIGRVESRRRIGEVLELVDMETSADQRMRSYSKGMLQRTGLAQALVNDPELLILDEPMGGLDPVGRHRVRSILHELKARGKTIFMSSHILGDVENLADRAAILSEGSVKRIVCMTDLVSDNAAKQVHCRQISEGVAQRLSSRGFVLHQRNDLTRIEVTRDADLPWVIGVLQESDACILRVEPLRSSLEDIFLRELGFAEEDLARGAGNPGSNIQRATNEVVEAVQEIQEVR